MEKYNPLTTNIKENKIMERINIAELLKDCPKGMELYSTLCGACKLDGVIQGIIHVRTNSNMLIALYSNGRYIQDGECVLFPSKEKRDWSTFQRPFKDGDVAVTKEGYIHLLKTEDLSYCAYRDKWEGLPKFDKTMTSQVKVVRFATEEEKQKLFDAIKANGYKWNAETKTLEKLIEPKFKVGDRIKSKNIHTNYLNDNHIFTITEISSGRYWSNRLAIEYIEKQDDWKLVPNKFYISTLKPFNKVLVRCNSLEKWHIQFFEKYNKELGVKYPFICSCNSKYCQCIPYEGNEHLLGTTNDCDEYYKTWE